MPIDWGEKQSRQIKRFRGQALISTKMLYKLPFTELDLTVSDQSGINVFLEVLKTNPYSLQWISNEIRDSEKIMSRAF